MSTPQSKAPPTASTPTSFPHPPSTTNPHSSPLTRSPATHRSAGKSPFNPASHGTPALKAETPASGSGSQGTAGGKNLPTGSSILKERFSAGGGAGGSGLDNLKGGGSGLGTSPAGVLDLASPAALGRSMSSQGLNLNLDGSVAMVGGGVGMGLSISGLGLSSLGLGARADDEERRRRLESVVGILAGKMGRVGEVGVERMCRRNGWATLWEERKLGGRRLTGAGDNVLVDVDFNAREGVEGVWVTVHEAGEGVKATMGNAGKVLERDLKQEMGKSSLGTGLERFARNLERLSKLDKLSKIQEGLNCYDAIAGVHTSLQRLYEHQFKAATEVWKDKRDAVGRAEREVMCKKSGRPRMHTRRTVGLALDYWQTITAKKSTPKVQNGEAMDIDKPSDSGKGEDGGDEGVFSLIIDAEPSPAALYPSLRTSNQWLSETIEKQPEQNPTDIDQLLSAAPNQPIIDWQEPPQTVLANIATGAAGGSNHAMALDAAGVGKLPDVRFSAKLDPPIVLPLQVAIQVLNQVGMNIPPESIRATTFESLVLQKPEHPSTETHGTTQTQGSSMITSEKRISIPSSTHDQLHQYTLFTPKTEYGRTLDELPFSHPRQIIQLLPILRQYAFLCSLLRSTFPTLSTSTPSNLQTRTTTTTTTLKTRKPANPSTYDDIDFLNGNPQPLTTHPSESVLDDDATAALLNTLLETPDPSSSHTLRSHTTSTQTLRGDNYVAPFPRLRYDDEEMPDFADPTTGRREQPLPVDVSLTLLPVPQMTVVFPMRGDKKTGVVTVEVGAGAEVRVVDTNLVAGDGGEERGKRMKALGRGLEVCGGEVGSWVEWVGERYA
ncbi:MAG: hypothetical protein M1820_009319 [Bogoriella megaspora]|nr:MAG: hypothetical protein M1820_009319 [Bogoriella megaspora]